MKLIRPIVCLFFTGAVAAGCTPGSALCKELQKQDVAVQITNDQGQTYNLCTGEVYRTQAWESDGGAPGYCDPFNGDTTCSTCLKHACCAELTACGEDDACLCWATENGIAGCTAATSPPATYAAMASCYSAGCPQCGGLR